jgi:LytR cell envelope-related transcriptional attenuator
VATDHPLGEVVLLKQPDAQTVVDRFLGRPPAPTDAPGAAAPANTQVTVLNALGTTGLAATTASKLRQSGYRVATVGNAPSADLARSQIAYAPGRLADAKALASTLVGGANLLEDPSLAASQLTLILGPGFTGIRPLGSSGSGSAGKASGSEAKKTRPKKAAPDLRPYDPRPC